MEKASLFMPPLSPTTTPPEHVARPPVQRRERLSAPEFISEYLVHRRPVVLSGQLRRWAALQRWTPDFFRDVYGEKVLRFPPQGDCEVRAEMREFIDALLINSPNQEIPRWSDKSLPFHFPALAADASPAPPHFSPNWLPRGFYSKTLQSSLARGSTYEIEIGSASTGCSPLHTNMWSTHAFHLQIFGSARFHLFSPDQARYLHIDPKRRHRSLIRDIEKAPSNAFPHFRRSTPMTITVSAGEILFLPARWWHTHRFSEPSITLSRNSVNRWNWSAVAEDLTYTSPMPKRLLTRLYLHGLAARHRLLDCFE